MRNKGVVVEITSRNHVIVMTPQGEFIRTPFKKHVHVGQEIRFSPKERFGRRQLGLVAVLLLSVFGSWSFVSKRLVPGSLQPSFVVTLDFASSLEMQLGAEQTVLEVTGLNQDGDNLLAALDVVGQDLSTALEQIADQAQKDGSFQRGQNQVVVTIASPDNQNVSLLELKNQRNGDYNELKEAITKAFGEEQSAQVHVWQVPLELQTKAKLAGITPSRYIAIHELMQPIIPQRLEARLTMRSGSEETRAISTGQSGLGTRPTLTPAQWTSQTATSDPSHIFNVSFPQVAQAKGDLRFLE